MDNCQAIRDSEVPQPYPMLAILPRLCLPMPLARELVLRNTRIWTAKKLDKSIGRDQMDVDISHLSSCNDANQRNCSSQARGYGPCLVQGCVKN